MPARPCSVLATCLLVEPLTLWSVPASAVVPTCFGQPATIVGTDGPDTLIGQSGVADVIYGGGGDDGIGGEHYDTAQSSSLDRVTAVENNLRVIRENGPSD